MKNGPKLPIQIRKKVNSDLVDLVNGKYFDGVPLGEIIEILKKYDLVLLQEDNTEFSGIISGREGKASIAIAKGWDGHNIYNKPYGYEPYVNSYLILTWYKMEETGRYETVVYLS